MIALDQDQTDADLKEVFRLIDEDDSGLLGMNFVENES